MAQLDTSFPGFPVEIGHQMAGWAWKFGAAQSNPVGNCFYPFPTTLHVCFELSKRCNSLVLIRY